MQLPDSYQLTTSNAMIVQMPQLGTCPPTMNQVKYIFKGNFFFKIIIDDNLQRENHTLTIDLNHLRWHKWISQLDQ